VRRRASMHPIGGMERQMRKRLLIILVVVGLVAAIPLAWFFYEIYPAIAYLRPFTKLTTADYTNIAKQWNPTVQAIYDFKAEHGSYPKQLSELVPKYISQFPTTDPRGPGFFDDFDGQTLFVWVAPHTYVIYIFTPGGDEGWACNGDFGVGPLPLPKLASTRPTTTAPVGE
jgi:hypothetical protein